MLRLKFYFLLQSLKPVAHFILTFLLSMISVTFSQLQSENIKWKIYRKKKSRVLNGSHSEQHKEISHHPAQDVSHPFVRWIYTVCDSHPLVLSIHSFRHPMGILECVSPRQVRLLYIYIK